MTAASRSTAAWVTASGESPRSSVEVDHHHDHHVVLDPDGGADHGEGPLDGRLAAAEGANAAHSGLPVASVGADIGVGLRVHRPPGAVVGVRVVDRLAAGQLPVEVVHRLLGDLHGPVGDHRGEHVRHRVLAAGVELVGRVGRVVGLVVQHVERGQAAEPGVVGVDAAVELVVLVGGELERPAEVVRGEQRLVDAPGAELAAGVGTGLGPATHHTRVGASGQRQGQQQADDRADDRGPRTHRHRIGRGPDDERRSGPAVPQLRPDHCQTGPDCTGSGPRIEPWEGRW